MMLEITSRYSVRSNYYVLCGDPAAFNPHHEPCAFSAMPGEFAVRSSQKATWLSISKHFFHINGTPSSILSFLFLSILAAMMMWYSTALVTSTASLLFSLPVEASIYSKDSPVLQVTSRTYDRLIAKSNHTSVSSRLCITMIK